MPRNAKAKKPIPSFPDEDREQDFWATRDSTEFVDWRRAKRTTLSGLRPSTKTSSLRLPDSCSRS